MNLPVLNQKVWREQGVQIGTDGSSRSNEATVQSPVTILQIGEGNFLRGFVDWMIHQARKQGLYDGRIAVTQPRPGGKPKIEALDAQDGLYTLVTRGLEGGSPIERHEVIEVFSRVFDPYGNWQQMLDLAASPSLQFIVSNTTEAGLVYRPEPYVPGEPVQSFPGKVAIMLYHRYLAVNGAPDKGLICLPCELLERNGDALRDAVLRYADDWGFPDAFKLWVVNYNRFLNSLVDRIVTGYPEEEQANNWFAEWGYRDPMLTTAEPYHLWAIEGEPELDELLPLQKAGLNVHWVEDLKPFQLRKVRILNGAHTLMTPLGILHGVEYVRETMEHGQLGRLVQDTVQNEIIPTLPIDREELQAYANDVFERFLNPFIKHRLSDIAMNSLSKFKVRLLPSLLHHLETQGSALPDGLVKGFAGLLRYYKVERTGEGFEGKRLDGSGYAVRDDAALLELIAGIWSEAEQRGLEDTVGRLLDAEELWGCDLAAKSAELKNAITKQIKQWEDKR